MNDINWAATLVFVLVGSITPGPGNIASASMGVLHGYRKTVPFLAGISSGFLLIMIASGIVSTAVLSALPGLEAWLRWIGAAYILFLAWKVLRSSMGVSGGDGETKAEVMGWGQGVILVLLNPKAYIFGLTIYGTFLAPLAGSVPWMLTSAVLLACECMATVSIWAGFGASIRKWLRNEKIAKAINTALALLLVYTAIDISGVLGLLGRA